MKKRLIVLGLLVSTIALGAAVGDRLKSPVMIGQGSAVAESVTFDQGLGGSNPSVKVSSASVMQFTAAGADFANASFIRVPDGAVGAPSYAFSSQTNTGMYRPSGSTIGFSVAGSLKATLDTNALTMEEPVWLPDGTAAAPTLAFSSETTTGLYQSSANTLGFATSGVERATLNNGAFTLDEQLESADGSASAPGYGFTAQTNTGMYRPAGTTIGFTTAGVQRMTIDNTTVTTQLPMVINGTGGSVPHGCIIRSNSTTGSSNFQDCSAGEIVLGGGCHESSGSQAMFDSYPSSTTRWSCGYAASATIIAYAICCAQ